MDRITLLREEIDSIDNTIMELLDKRYDLAREIGLEKKHFQKQVLDVNREDSILNKTSKYSHSPQLEAVYRTIMSESKKLQRK